MNLRARVEKLEKGQVQPEQKFWQAFLEKEQQIFDDARKALDTIRQSQGGRLRHSCHLLDDLFDIDGLEGLAYQFSGTGQGMSMELVIQPRRPLGIPRG